MVGRCGGSPRCRKFHKCRLTTPVATTTVVCTADRVELLERLLKRANALYIAKRNGRNRVEFAPADVAPEPS